MPNILKIKKVIQEFMYNVNVIVVMQLLNGLDMT